eukprot:PhF_6_TR32349/c0_g1_i1/m.47967
MTEEEPETTNLRQLLEQKETELVALESKFTDWKVRAKQGVEQQRKIIHTLEQQVSHDKLEYDKHQQRVEATMKLKDLELQTLRSQVESLEIEVRAAKMESTTLTKAVVAKDEEIIRERAATDAIQRRLEEMEQTMRAVNEGRESIKEEIENSLWEQMETKLQHMQRIHEAEISALTSAVGMESQIADKRKDLKIAELTNRVQELTVLNEKLRDDIAMEKEERKRDLAMEREKREKQTVSSLPTSTTSAAASAMDEASESPVVLKKRIASQAEQLWVLGNEVARLKAALETREASTTPYSKTPSPHHPAPAMTNNHPSSSEGVVNIGYLRSVLVRFLSERNDDVKGNILPVLATMLAFSTQ